jgi:hypothetical protein
MGHPEHEEVVCFFGEFTSDRGVSVRTPNGNNTLDCSFEGLPPIPETIVQKNFLCTIVHAGTSVTSNSQWVRKPNGVATMFCQFSDKPVFDAAVAYGNVGVPAQQALFTTPLSQVPGQAVTAELVDVGLACNGNVMVNDPAGRIALIERGACVFGEKVANAFAAGAVGVVVYNSAAGGDAIVAMFGTDFVPIPAVFVGRSDGLALQAAAPVTATILACARSASCRGSL